MMDYITKKIPRNLAGRLNRLKARMELRGTRKVTEGEVFALALQRLEEEMEKEKRYTLRELAGTLRFKGKVDPKDIDKIVYGV